jgi:FlgN protein
LPSAEPRTPLDQATGRLEDVLTRMIGAHEQLLGLAGEHRAAMSRADGALVQRLAMQQAELARQIGDLEAERRRVVSLLIPGVATSQPTFAVLTTQLPEPARGRIAGLGRRLRELLLKVQAEHRVIRSATHALIAHMDGLVQQVARALSQAGVYGPRGRLDHVPAAPCGLDLTH